MTINELSEVAGCNEKTVRRISKELFQDYFKNGVKTVFSKAQCFDIMQKLPKKNLVQMSEVPSQNALPSQSVEVVKMFQVMMEQNQKFMTAVLGEIKNINNQPLQIEQPKQDYFSLIAYCSINHFPTVQSELRKMGMDLRKMCIESGKDLHKIPDERYGQVNSYPVEILNEYFSE